MINLTAVIDNDEFQRRLREMRDSVRGTTNSIVKDAQRIDTVWQGVASSLKGSKGFGAKLLQGLKPIVPQVEAIRNGVEGIRVDFERFPTIPPLQSLPETTASAARGFNALNFATQQLVREVPAATMGLHMFFLAISNNLPYFADAIKQVREENKALAASGKPTTSVFKQIIGSLFSWQTALIAGITALTLYGKEIGNWVANLFKSKDALSAAEKAQKSLNSAIKEQGLGIGDDIIKLKELQRTWLSLGNDMTARNKFILDNKAAFDDLGVSISNVAEADSLFINNTQAFIQALMLRAQASAAQKLAEEKYEEWFRKRQEYIDEREAGISASDRFNAAASGLDQSATTGKSTGKIQTADELHQNRISILKNEAKEIKNEADAMFDLSVEYNNNANELLKAAGFMSFGGGAGNGDDKTSEFEERVKTIKRLNNDLSKEVQRTQREMDDAEIAAIKDGIERKRREIQAGYERRAAEIDKYEADIKAAQGGELTPEQKGHISYLRQANTDTLMAGKVLIKAMQDEAAREAADAMNEYLASYGTFQEKLVAITAKYSRLIADAKTEGERKMYEAERDAILAQFEVEASAWVKELANKSVKELKVMAEGLQSVVDSLQAEYDAMGSSDTQEAKDLLETINYLNAQIAQLKERLGEAKNSVDNDTWKDSALVFQGISSSANDIANSLGNIDSGAAQAIRTMGQMAGVVGNMITAITTLTTATTALQGALGFLGIIAAALSAITLIFNAFERNAEAAREATNAIREYERALDALESREIKSARSGIFGSDDYGIFIESLAKAKEQLLELEKIRKGFSQAIISTSGGALINNTGGEAPLIADMRTGWQKFWGTGDENIKITGLDEFYENGVLNLDKLKAYYDSYKDYMNEAQADLVKQLIDKAEAYEENMATVKEYMTGLFGELGASITNSLVDAFRNGTDAATAMGDAVSGVMEQIATDMAHAAFIQPLLNEAQDAINALNAERGASGLSDEEYMRRLMEISSGLMSDATAQGEAMTQYLDNLKRMAAEQGIDIFESDTQKQQATSKGFQTMSQETGSELNGRFTDIQGQTHRIAEVVEFCRGLQSQQLQQVQSINDTVAKIHNNVDLIATHTRELRQMREDLSSIKTAIYDGAI